MFIMELRKYIDHTLLKPDATEEQINQIIEDAKTYQFASVCVNPYWVDHCYDRLKETNVKVCTVIGFPLGSSTTSIKVAETKEAIQSGAEEVDMVINIGALKMNDDETVKNDILAVVNAAKDKALVKVIIETALLNNDEKKRACQLALEAGADFVKTSTGFLGGGATVEDVKLMRQTVGDHMGVKASGGIRDRKTAEAMIAAGATRIGASSGVSIVQEEK